MRVDSINLRRSDASRLYINPNVKFYNDFKTYDSVSFTGLMSNSLKHNMKMCVFDLDETLLEGSQEYREKIFKFVKDNKKILVYSSARSIDSVNKLIENGVLIQPNFCVCCDGKNIYKNNNGVMEEITSWSENFAANFHRDKIREVLLGFAKENMLPKEQWDKIPPERVANIEGAFAGSKISETYGAFSDLEIRFVITEDIFNKIRKKVKRALKKLGIDVIIRKHVYEKHLITVENYKNYYPEEIAVDLRKTLEPRLNSQGGYHCLIISVPTNKGKATEYIRNLLKLKRREVFAAGDSENDFSNTTKGYIFALLANASRELKKLINLRFFSRFFGKIIKTSKPGAEGLWQVLEP